MEFIIDVQGFKSLGNEFIVKELALISTDAKMYELHIFKPPCNFFDLPHHVQKQVLWLEKAHHGLFWGSGFRKYDQLKDIFANLKISGNVYVKGKEKQKIITDLLSKPDVNVINLEDLGCPNLQELKSNFYQPQLIKPCVFLHNPLKCAYINVYVLLQWWKTERLIEERLANVNMAIAECYSKGYKGLRPELVKFLPKEFISTHYEDVENIYDNLPEYLKNDVSILLSMRCSDHYKESNGDTFDGPNPKRKHCPFCVVDFYKKYNK